MHLSVLPAAFSRLGHTRLWLTVVWQASRHNLTMASDETPIEVSSDQVAVVVDSPSSDMAAAAPPATSTPAAAAVAAVPQKPQKPNKTSCQRALAEVVPDVLRDQAFSNTTLDNLSNKISAAVVAKFRGQQLKLKYLGNTYYVNSR